MRQSPQGLFTEKDTALEAAPVPHPEAGQALVQTLMLAMDPVTRIIIERDIKVVPSIEIGDPLRSFGGGVVLKSCNPALPEGALVCGFFDWAELQLVEEGLRTQVLAPDIMLEDGLNILGHTAMAAYFGMSEFGKPKAGETVVVTGAGGAVGSVAAQLAKATGAHVTGIARGEAKCQWLVAELGLDSAIDASEGGVSDKLAAIYPHGVDLFFDTVGGALQDNVFQQLKKGSRLVACGASSLCLTANPLPQLRDQTELTERGVTMSKFNAMEYAPRFAEATKAMRALQGRGLLQFPYMVVEGFENAPDAFNMLFDRRSRGRVLVRIAPA